MKGDMNMKAVQIKPNIYWVGAIDWSMRTFHGYSTGSMRTSSASSSSLLASTPIGTGPLPRLTKSSLK